METGWLRAILVWWLTVLYMYMYICKYTYSIFCYCLVFITQILMQVLLFGYSKENKTGARAWQNTIEFVCLDLHNYTIVIQGWLWVLLFPTSVWQSSYPMDFFWLTLSPPNKMLSAKLPVCFIFKVFQCRSKLVNMLSECQTAWILVRCQVTRRLIQIQAVCIWNYSCAWRARV